jgi:hypothetical protein
MPYFLLLFLLFLLFLAPLSSHPGANVILRKSGGLRDCTEDYNFHRAMGQRFWNERKIGVVSS